MSKRFVVDTSTLISALLFPKSIPRQSLDHAQIIGVVLQSVNTNTELDVVLRRSKFDKYLSESERFDFFASLNNESLFIEITTTIRECRDHKDDKFLELAIDGRADFIISSDDDLLVLHPFRDIQILTPRAFLDLELS
jgi:hypothetical protein